MEVIGGRAFGFGGFDDGDIKKKSFTMRNVLISYCYEERLLEWCIKITTISSSWTKVKGFCCCLVSLYSFNSKVEGMNIIEFESMKKRDKCEFYKINLGFSLGLES